HSTLSQIPEQPGDGTIDAFGLAPMFAWHVAMRIPCGSAKLGAGPELNEPHTALQESPGQQTTAGEVTAFRLVKTIKRTGLLALLGEVGRTRHCQLHPGGQLVTAHARDQRIA